jgi:CRISPR-associated protein Csm5
MATKKPFVLEIRTLTFLHIGTGKVLQENFDYVVRDNQTLRIHEGRFVEWISSQGEALARMTQGSPPGQLLGAHLRPGSPLVRYALPGAPRDTREIRECLKDAFDRPYIPGSSVKGALRTVLLWQRWKAKGLTLSRVRLRDNPRFAAKDVEGEEFGKTPHEDVFRALLLRDSSPVEREKLVLANVRSRAPGARAGIPLALEAVPAGITFTMEGYLDTTVFRPWGAWTKEGFLSPEKLRWLAWENLAQAARQKALARLDKDRNWAKSMGIDPAFWEDLDKKIRKADAEKNLEFPLQIGFGTGWLGVTLGPALLADPNFHVVHGRFRLGRRPRSQGQTPPERFPASRRLVCVNSTDLPLGWVWVVPREVS